MLGAVLLLCAVAASGALGQTTEVSQCTVNQGELPINSYIEDCITPPCGLPQLQDCVINIIFRAPRTMRRMTTLATAFIPMGPIMVPITYNLRENAITCNFLTNSYCPVMENEVLQYTLKMFIESAFPVGTLTTIEFRVVDENMAPVLCLRVAVRIDPPVGYQAALMNSTLLVN